MTPSWARPIVLYTDGFTDNRPSDPRFEDEEFVALLTSFDDPKCHVDTCVGRTCPVKENGLCWSPAQYPEGATRSDENVIALNYAVFDLDHLKVGELDSVRANIAEYEHVIHSTHSHAPGDECYRLIFPVTRPILRSEWRAVFSAIIAALALPADISGKVESRLYGCPIARGGVEPFATHRRGKPLDVDEALEVARQLGQVVPPPKEAPPPPKEAPVTYDLGALRERLREARRSKAASAAQTTGPASEKCREQAEILGRILDGEPLAKVGARDATILRACGLLAYWLPAEVPWEVVQEIFRPSLSAMLDAEPDDRGLDYMFDVARVKFQRQADSRAAADAKRAADDAKVKELARQIATKGVAAAVAAATAEGGDWAELLIETKTGYKACEHNIDLILSCADETRGTLRWNDVHKRFEIVGGPFANIPTASLAGKVAGWLQATYRCDAGEKLVGRSLVRVAMENPYDPLAEYLGEIAWDGESRLDTFLEHYLAADTASTSPTYVQGISRRWLIGLVARALRPGCKMDNVLILEGMQGAGKSTALEALVGSEHFLDTALELGNKDTMQAIASAWLVELGELASLRGREVDRQKQFITSKVDKFRPPYGDAVVESPRRCVLCGTTNPDGAGYLRDRTGNRRYWPVRVGEPDVDGVLRDRDLILAEAVAAFRAGERWWFDRKADAPLIAEAAAETEDRLEVSAVEEAIERWWYGEAPEKRPVRLSLLDVVELALRLPTDRIDHSTRVEVGRAMRRIGFEYQLRRDSGERTRYYEATPEMRAAPRRTSVARAAGLAVIQGLKEKANGGSK